MGRTMTHSIWTYDYIIYICICIISYIFIYYILYIIYTVTTFKYVEGGPDGEAPEGV